MGSTGRTLGIILMAVGVGACILGAVFFGMGATSGRAGYAMVLGFALLFLVLVAPLVGIGGYLFVKGRQEEAQLANVKKERRILDMVQTQGQVQISELVLELAADVDQVKAWIYDLVGKGLFTGYINWEEGVLYSRQISELRTNRCPRCGGEVGLGGKGVVRCPYCGTEIFLK
ncbi:MAG: hypothetical protein ACUVXG_08195 [Anaerolineae bacterium]